MERETVINSIQELPSETKVKAWVFEVDKKFYHLASYSRFRMGDQCSIWTSNKRGKRVSENPVFSREGGDHLKCIDAFLDKLELERIDSGLEG